MDIKTSIAFRRRRLQVLLWRGRFLILTVCLALAAGIALDALRPPAEESTEVVALTSDVSAGTVLSSDDVAVVQLSGRLPGDVLSLSDDAVGRRTVIDLSAGTSLSESLLVPAESQFALGGRHAIPVPLASSGLVPLYPPGTRVRVVITPDSFGASAGRAETLVVDDAVVLPPIDTPSSESDGSGLLGLPAGGAQLGSNYLLLGVSPSDAVMISSIGTTSDISVIIVE